MAMVQIICQQCGEPSLFDRLPFGEVQAIGTVLAQTPATAQDHRSSPPEHSDLINPKAAPAVSQAQPLQSERCPDGLLPDGPTCPRCGGKRGPSGVDGGSWVHYGTSAAPVEAVRALLTDEQIKRIHDRCACLPDMVGRNDQWPEILRFARAIEAALGIPASAQAGEGAAG